MCTVTAGLRESPVLCNVLILQQITQVLASLLGYFTEELTPNVLWGVGPAWRKEDTGAVPQ